ncbi:uncharacterized protein [Physcomitrium patens]|uniref:uncharacterized protein isoform X5 n=1 Tax=Physcomitrium patens TaxID=3218 RepID=UPI003CCC9414
MWELRRPNVQGLDYINVTERPLAVFSFWFLVVVAVAIFHIYRAWHVRKHPCSPVTLSETSSSKSARSQNTYQDCSGGNGVAESAAAESVIEVEESEGGSNVQFDGYRKVIGGEICWCLLILGPLQWICLYIVVLLDAYYSCQLTGINNLCFYGTYFIFGSYDRNGSVFFTLWCLSAIWFTVLVVYKREMHNWFRLPCALASAHVVQVWAKGQQQILSVKVLSLVHIVRKVKDTLSRHERLDHTETVAVTRTEMGTLHFLSKGQRHLISEDGTLHLAHFDGGHTFRDFHKVAEGLSRQEARARYDKIGPNEMPYRPEAIWVSIAEEMFTLFKVYQFLIYSIWLWLSYLFVGALLLSIVLVAALITTANRRRAQFAIAKLTEYESNVEVKRDGNWTNIDFLNLIPGDVVKVYSNWSLPCDLLIIKGVCVCNESNLTGEAIPVHKYSSPENDSVYEADSPGGAHHTLFSGTQVLQAGAGDGSTEALGIVTATGMSTSKGRLLSMILFPEQMVFKYDEELPIVVGLLLCYAAVCFAMSLIFQYRNGQQSTWITKWSYCIAIISQIMSPLLPVSLEIGQIYASERLKNLGIFCLNAKRIATAGKIRVFCFDKTGTLTNGGLDFIGLRGVENSQFCPTQSPLKHDLIPNILLQGLATCHAVTKFGAQFVGNEVEVKMFSSVGWDLAEGVTTAQPYPTVFNRCTGDAITILRRNEFQHPRATMSVVIRDNTGELHVYCKGSFEKIQEVSSVASLPVDYIQTAKNHALNGCYVLGLSHKQGFYRGFGERSHS